MDNLAPKKGKIPRASKHPRPTYHLQIVGYFPEENAKINAYNQDVLLKVLWMEMRYAETLHLRCLLQLKMFVLALWVTGT